MNATKLLTTLNREAIDIASSLVFDAKYFNHLVAVSLFGTILELVNEVISNDREGPKTSIPILSRSILECFVDLKNIVNDDEYAVSIEFDWLRGWKIMVDQAKLGNKYLVSVASDPNLQAIIDECERMLKEVKKKKPKKLTIQQKFKMAGLSDEYETIYRSTSSHVHGGLQALIDRHVDLSDSKNPKIHVFTDRPIEDFDPYLGSIVEILVQATELVHSYLDAPSQEKVDNMRTKADEYRAEVSA